MPQDILSQSPAEDAPARLSDYTRPVVDRLLLVVATVLVVAVATYVYYDRQPDVFAATTSIYLTSPNPNPLAGAGAGAGINDRTTVSQARLLTTRAVAVRVARQLSFPADPDALRRAVTAVPTVGSDFIVVSARWTTGQRAADIANAFATEFIRTRSEQQRDSTQRLLTRLQAQARQIPRSASSAAERADLQAQIRQLQLSLRLPASGAEQVDPATNPAVPVEPRPMRNAIFAGLLALLAAVGLAFGLDRFDRRIRRAEDARDAYKLPLLSVVPHVTQFSPGGQAPAAFVEAFRLLQTNIRLARVDAPPRVIVVTSAVPGEGKSTVVRYLAEAFSEWGKKVAVIDADLRRPSLTRLYGVMNGEGLTDLVGAASSNGAAARALVEVARPRIGGTGADAGGDEKATPTAEGEEGKSDPSVGTMTVARSAAARPGSELAPVHVLAAGAAPPNPAALLASARTRQLIEEISAIHDVVIIDTPPVLAVSDALALVPFADAAILVCRVGKTTRDEAQRLVDALQRIPDAQLLGVVANDESSAGGDRYGYYYNNG